MVAELFAPELYYNTTLSPRTPTTSPTSIPCATLPTSLTITSPGLALQPALQIRPGLRHHVPRFSGLCQRPGRPVCQRQLTGMEMQKDTYIPVFTNRPQDYREWRQQINLYRRKLELHNKSKEAVLNVLTSLHGVAWRQLEPKVETILAKEDGGFDLILAELDATFRYNEDVEMPRAFERFFYGLNQKPDQTLLAYAADHREALHEVEKHGVQISDKVSGWILLRRSGLSSEQKQLIQSQCPKLSYDKVVKAMFVLLGQDYKSRSLDSQSTIWKGKTYGRWSNKNYGYTWWERATTWRSPTTTTTPIPTMG